MGKGKKAYIVSKNIKYEQMIASSDLIKQETTHVLKLKKNEQEYDWILQFVFVYEHDFYAI